MYKFSSLTVTVLGIFLSHQISAKDDRALSIHAGAAERNISPPAGLDILHPFRKNIGINDPLFVRTLVLEDAFQTSVAIITADIICAGFAACDELRHRIKTKAKVDEVWFNCSHSHSSRWLSSTQINAQDWTEELAWDEFRSRPISESHDEDKWNSMVHEAALSIVIEAKQKSIPVTLRAGRAPVQIGFNRRVTSKNGRTHMGVNKNGLVVPWVNILMAEARDNGPEIKKGDPLAILFEHPAHPVTVPNISNLVSADFPGAAIARIREKLGKTVVALYGQGCNGNINSFPLRSSHADADAAGKKLGDAVLEAIRQSDQIIAKTIELRNKRIWLPTRALPSMEIVSKLKLEAKGHPERLKQLEKIAKCIAQGKKAPPRRFDVYGIILDNEWSLIGMSYETFAQYELWIAKNAPFKRTMVFSLTNGGRAYIGTDDALMMGPNGGYEVGCLPNWDGHETMSPYFGPPAVGSEKLIHEAFRSLWQKHGAKTSKELKVGGK